MNENTRRAIIWWALFLFTGGIILSIIYGPFWLATRYTDKAILIEQSTNFLNNLVGISALVLSIVAIWITVRGLDWQRELQIKIESLVDSVRRVEQHLEYSRQTTSEKRIIKKKASDYEALK